MCKSNMKPGDSPIAFFSKRPNGSSNYVYVPDRTIRYKYKSFIKRALQWCYFTFNAELLIFFFVDDLTSSKYNATAQTTNCCILSPCVRARHYLFLSFRCCGCLFLYIYFLCSLSVCSIECSTYAKSLVKHGTFRRAKMNIYAENAAIWAERRDEETVPKRQHRVIFHIYRASAAGVNAVQRNATKSNWCVCRNLRPFSTH